MLGRDLPTTGSNQLGLGGGGEGCSLIHLVNLKDENLPANQIDEDVYQLIRDEDVYQLISQLY